MVHHARCECGAVVLDIEGDPAFVALCSCRNCQRRSGGPVYVSCFFKKEQLVGVHGELKEYEHFETDTGRRITRNFCPRCGTNLFVDLEMAPGLYNISGGALDRFEDITPNLAVYQRSAPDWLTLAQGVTLHDMQP